MEELQQAWQSEQAGGAYKDQVVTATEDAGLSRRVARFTPIGNVKGYGLPCQGIGAISYGDLLVQLCCRALGGGAVSSGRNRPGVHRQTPHPIPSGAAGTAQSL